MNLCVRLKVLWTEDEIKIKSVSIGGEDISSMQNFPSLMRGGGREKRARWKFCLFRELLIVVVKNVRFA